MTTLSQEPFVITSKNEIPVIQFSLEFVNLICVRLSIIYRYLASISGPFPDVVYEVEAYIADTKYVNASTHTNTLYTNLHADNTVYSMWIGTNDLGVGVSIQ